MDVYDDLYATSPSNSDISQYSNSTTSSIMNDDVDLYISKPKKSGKKKNKNRNKQKFQQFIREESNIFEIFNHNDDMYQDFSNQKKTYTTSSNEIEFKNKVQEEYMSYLTDDNIPIVFSTGPAGTGKTFLACHYAITSFLKGDIEKIIITRPTVSVDEDHGFLPGDLNDKMKPWLRPIYDIFEKYVSHTYMERLIKEETIEICPLAFMRGRTFENCIIIADEMQNSTESQMKMILTRISFGSKLIINGDLNQSDNRRNGLKDFLNKYEHSKDPNKDNIKIVKFKNSDVQRHSIIETVLNIYE
jgi:phosphate starvation-inducible PhoH-like protein